MRPRLTNGEVSREARAMLDDLATRLEDEGSRMLVLASVVRELKPTDRLSDLHSAAYDLGFTTTFSLVRRPEPKGTRR